jgi:hypothetical protein
VDPLLEGPKADPLPAVLEAFAQPVQRHEIVVGVRQLARTRHRRLAELEVGISRRHPRSFAHRRLRRNRISGARGTRLGHIAPY